MMRIHLIVVAALALLIPAAPATAQERAWIQIEAQPTLARAQASLRDYAARLADVNGFTLGAGWYAIALGPFEEQTARDTLRRLRRAGAIPRDSYVAASSDYGRQFWPVGADLLGGASQDTITLSDPLPDAIPVPDPVDETPGEARASERLLSRDRRAELQIALQWAGHYDGAIDAAFGRGTRAAMGAWQAANGYTATGILTTRQRAALLGQYNAILDGLGLRVVENTRAGIAMKLPMGVVSLDRYESPFARYTASGALPAQVLLISQQGDDRTLGGLYDIMQTLEIVPREGRRRLEQDTFLLIGRDAQRVSHTQAWLRDGEIKGFTLIWPAGDEERRMRLLGEMQESFTRLPGVLPASAGATQDQSRDLVAGLQIRKPRLSRSGFFVDRTGTVVTTAEAVQGCGRITLDQVYDAQVVAEDTESGIAVLRPQQRLAPMSVASFQMAVPRLQSDVAVAGYSYGGMLGAPTLTFGRLADLEGLDGAVAQKRLALNALEGDAGGPVMDASGGVLGMLLPAPKENRRLPEGVSFAANAGAVAEVLTVAGISPAAADGRDPMAAEALTRKASGMTVLVSCWE